MVIDFHTHVFPPDMIRERESLVLQDPCFRELYSSSKAKFATADDLLSSMDREGIAISVILNIGWASPELCRRTNDYILEAAARHPDRLVGFCSVQPKSIDAVPEIERCAQGGIRGIGEIRPDLQGFDLADLGVMAATAETARQLNLILLTHTSEPVGHSYPGKGSITPDRLYPFIASFPELSIVCAHWGGGLPFYALMPEVAQALRNVFFDTAASPFLYSYDIFPRVADLVGADRILFGSDYPLIAQGRIVAKLRKMEMPQESIAAILGNNARRLLGIQ